MKDISAPTDTRYVNIVSGLPRSGTSLMMQMLATGGIPPLSDHVRTADEDNPKGYYEFEPVKRTRQDPSWLEEAGGKVVKMVHLLLYDLPAGREYRVVFMRRALEEVVASQKVMLTRLGRDGANLGKEQLIAAYEKQVVEIESWLEQRANFSVLQIQYNDLVRDPEPHIGRLDEFFGGGLDLEAMRGIIDPSLYRQRC